MLKYVLVTDDIPDSGVLKKARYQVATLNDLGVAAELVVITPEKQQEEPESGTITYFYYGKLDRKSLFARLRRAQRIRRILRDIITPMNPDDIFYYRGLEFIMLYYPLAFFRPFRRCRILSEHQSVEINQHLLYHSYGAALIDVLTGSLITGQSDGIIGVTEEITAFWKKRLPNPDIPRITIPNGFTVGSVAVRTPPRFDAREIHLLFVGNVSRWHGLDRMVEGIADYQGPVSIHLHIVGDGDELEQIKKIKNTRAPTADIHFYGFMSGPALTAMFDSCHLAIGSLGLHRNRMNQASSLKVREYCSRGIPFILSNQDPDFPDTFPYCLHVDPTDAPVPLEEVLSFAEHACENPDHPGIMRAYAQEHLDWHVKGQRLITFIGTIPGVRAGQRRT